MKPGTVTTIDLTGEEHEELDRRFAALHEARERRNRHMFYGDTEGVTEAVDDILEHASEIASAIAKASNGLFPRV